MHTLNFMSYGFRFPRHVFWGFKPWIIPESKRSGATSQSCYSAYATSTYLGVKGTGTHRLQGLIFFLLSCKYARQIYLKQRNYPCLYTLFTLKQLSCLCKLFCLCVGEWCWENQKRTESRISLKMQILLVEAEKHQETGRAGSFHIKEFFCFCAGRTRD